MRQMGANFIVPPGYPTDSFTIMISSCTRYKHLVRIVPMNKDMTPEEAIIKLRQMVQAFTGFDPRVGQKAKPVRELTEEEIAKLFEGKDEPSPS